MSGFLLSWKFLCWLELFERSLDTVMMPSAGDEMEPANSTHSLPSGRSSGMGSQYITESGLYMSSFAATMFIAGLVTVGVLMLTMLVALIVMLQSCESSNSGAIRKWMGSEKHDYCKIFAFQAELNNLEVDEIPEICKANAIQYIAGGQYLRDLNLTLQVADSCFSSLAPEDDNLDVILMDLDDVFLSYILDNNKFLQLRDGQIEDVKHLAKQLVSRLYKRLRKRGWALILFTRVAEKQRNITIDTLISSGLEGWHSLIMRSDDELLMDNWEYLSRMRLGLHNQGFRIASAISSRIDVVTGPCTGKRNFKLPTSIPYTSQYQGENVAGI